MIEILMSIMGLRPYRSLRPPQKLAKTNCMMLNDAPNKPTIASVAPNVLAYIGRIGMMSPKPIKSRNMVRNNTTRALFFMVSSIAK